jgi:hypothetical protein
MIKEVRLEREPQGDVCHLACHGPHNKMEVLSVNDPKVTFDQCEMCLGGSGPASSPHRRMLLRCASVS